MDFKLVAKAAVQRDVREGTYSEDLVNAVKELWEISQQHGSTHFTETEPFPSEDEANKWMAKAQSYGKTQGLFVHRARGVVPSVANALVLWVESTQDRVNRIEKRKAKEAEKAAEKAAPGAKLQERAAQQKAAQEAGKTPQQQGKK